MKYTRIAAALGWEETPDNQEGLFLQPEEAATLDAALGNDNAEALATANETITTLNGEISNLKTAATAAAENETRLNNRIAELEAENAELGKESSGNGTVVTTTEDVITGTGKTPSYLDDTNPINSWADQRMKRKTN